MRILGLDPGSQHTGYGVVEKRGSRLLALGQGRISPPRKAPLPQRLAFLARELRTLVHRHEPEVAVLESLFHGINPRSLIVLAQARGVLLATLSGEGLEIVEYSPSEIKQAVTGYGRADKEQVGRMVRQILGLGAGPLPSDASDALAASICAAQRWRWERLESLAEARRKAGK